MPNLLTRGPASASRACAAWAIVGGTLWLAAVAHTQDARELTVTGCLLSNGYAGYLIENAVLEAIDGKAVDAAARSSGPSKWVLDGGGNLRRNVGEKVQVVGRSDWRAESKDDQPGTPHLEVLSVKTVASSCK